MRRQSDDNSMDQEDMRWDAADDRTETRRFFAIFLKEKDGEEKRHIKYTKREDN